MRLTFELVEGVVTSLHRVAGFIQKAERGWTLCLTLAFPLGLGAHCHSSSLLNLETKDSDCSCTPSFSRAAQGPSQPLMSH